MKRQYVIGYGFSTGSVCNRQVEPDVFSSIKAAKSSARLLPAKHFQGFPQIAVAESFEFIASVQPTGYRAPQRTKMTPDQISEAALRRVVIGDTML